MKTTGRRLRLPLAWLFMTSVLVGAAVIGTAFVADVSEPREGAFGAAATRTRSVSDQSDHSSDMTWEQSATLDGLLCNKVRVTRTAVLFLGIQTGCRLDVTYTAASASQLERVRLAYDSWLGAEVILDDASEANDRVTSMSASATVSGTVPATARNVRLLWTADGGTEYVVEEHVLCGKSKGRFTSSPPAPVGFPPAK